MLVNIDRVMAADKQIHMWINFIGSFKVNLENCIKYFAIIVILLDNSWSSGSGLIAPVNNVDKSVGDGSSGSIYNHSTDDDNGTAMNQHQQTSVMDYAGSNSINDEYMMELSSANINKTFFRSSNNSIITSQVGSIVHLPCRVHLLGDEMISWIRRKDFHLLTVGLTTYSSDERFSAIHYEESGDWQLKIRFVQLRDRGTYECAVSSHPSISLFIHLEVTEARAEIDGPPERFLRVGSVLRLTCRVIKNIENPIYLFWYHNNRMINYDYHLGVNVTIEKDNKFSELLIVQTTVAFSGNYSCAPSNASPASVLVHIILNGENPIGLAAYGGAGEPAIAKNQSIYVQALLLLLSATYQFIFILQTS